MSVREPFSWIEIDVDGCALTFGTGACTAALGVNGVVRKCYNLFNTCRSTDDFDHILNFRTLRYCQPRSNIPKGMTFYPAMVGEPSEFSATVNIAGSDADLSAFGRRATIKTTLLDFPDHDRYMDPYQAERVAGTAQTDEPGYDPRLRGTHFSKLKSRWPFYAGRPYRRCDGYLVNGVVVDVTVRHYVITNLSGPGNDMKVVLEGSDVLDLADDKRSQAPKATNGVLGGDIPVGLTSFTLQPEDIGDAVYPASGRARIGSEFVDYTRAGDVITLTARGVSNTTAATHKTGDTFQVVKRFVNQRIDDVVAELLIDAGINPAFLPLVEWAAEVDRWLTGTMINRDIGTPTGVKALISSMVPLGFSLWWSASEQKIKLKANRPVDGDPIHNLSDFSTNLEVAAEEDDRKRVSEVLFWTVQKSSAGSPTSTENYTRTWAATDLSAREAWRYRTGQIKNYLCPWLDTGADAIVRVAARRLLLRFATTPKKFRLTLDAEKWGHIDLTDVVRLRTHGLQDETGKGVTALYQVIQRSEPRAGERLEIVVQSYQFSGRFAFATPNDAPEYMAATEEQRDPGMFACNSITLRMPDGSPPYEAI